MSDRRRIAPWTDHQRNTLREGDRIRHPDGQTGTIVYMIGKDDPWRVTYADAVPRRLQLQIGATYLATLVVEQ